MKVQTKCKKCDKTQVEALITLICECGGAKQIIGFNNGDCSYNLKTNKLHYPTSIHLTQ